MNTRPGPRRERSVRLNDREWAVAEALACLEGETGAAFGLRSALKAEEKRAREVVGDDTVNDLVTGFLDARQSEVTR